MDRIEYILKNIYNIFSVAIRLMNNNGKIIWMPFEGFDKIDPVCCNLKLWEAVYKSGTKEEKKYSIHDDNGYIYYIFHQEDCNVVWGPFLLEPHSEYENHLYLRRNHVEDNQLYISLFDMNHIRQMISFIHGILFEEYLDKNAVFEETQSEEVTVGFQANLSEYMVEKADQERGHFSFQRENQFFEYMVEGKIDFEEVFHFFPGDLDDFRDLYDGQGVIAKSQKKSAEYTLVSFITLLTRHAIAAGVNETEAYMLSDISLQKLSKAKDMMEMERIGRNSIWQFIQILREHNKTDGGGSFYIEQSKDYIAKHIFEKISLQEVADHVGIHPAYLSRLFSEQVGVGMLNYILQEKIHISCNLLKYSGKPIAVIAEYVNLSPQSYFSKVFKKVMDQTPAQYRREHRNIKF